MSEIDQVYQDSNQNSTWTEKKVAEKYLKNNSQKVPDLMKNIVCIEEVKKRPQIQVG